MFSAISQQAFARHLRRVYGWYTVGFILFLTLLTSLEQVGLSKRWIGYSFLLATVALYAAIGILSRTSDLAEYYVAGRRVPAVYNGMAIGADWMSAASFIGLAGTLYLSGYAGLAFVMGWTGGYCLVALLLAPYLRRFGEFTIPDFLGARYGGSLPRLLGVVATVLCSFTYVVAQIYGVGLITTRLTGVSFELGIFLGLGGILVCSFLGGMRAVTWTQVAQYIILIVAYMIPVVWLAAKHTHVPLPQIVYGSVLEKVSERERQLVADPREHEVQDVFRGRAADYEAKLRDVRGSLSAERAAAVQQVERLKNGGAPAAQIHRAERALASLPKDEAAARAAWTRAMTAAEARSRPLAGMPPHAEPFPGRDEAEQGAARKNFLALVFCLMVGTAALPHILTRYYTTPSVREARESVVWSALFIFLLYITAPAFAVLVKYEVFSNLVGQDISRLPEWIAKWSAVDRSLLSVTDVNGDGILQLGEMAIDGDIVVLATPEMVGLPYVISGLIAAGGLAAALSTADGLLLTIASALSHDFYYKMVDPQATTQRRVVISKMLLVVVALCAAWMATQKPADILFLVSAAFSLAAAGFFPALVCGIFWRRANKWGAAAGMLVGLGVTFGYMCLTQPWLRSVFQVSVPLSEAIIWDIQPISAGVFGVPLGFMANIVVSLLTPAPGPEIDYLLARVRSPTPGP